MGFVSDLRSSSRLGLLVAGSAATVGVIYGYDQSNIAGALLPLTTEFQLTTHDQELVTTAVVVGQIVGALGGGALANRIGRKASMLLVALGFGVFSLLSGLAFSVPSLLVARLLLGVTVGVSIVVAPVFVAESAPTRVRGAMLVLYQVATVIGIIAGYLVAWAFAGAGSWRLLLGLAAVPAALVTVDRFGRKPTLLTGIGIMVAANVLLVVVFLFSSSFGGVLTVLGFVGLVLFTVGFTFGFGSLVWVYAGESFPARLRATGASAMLTADLVANAIVAALFLTMLNGLGGVGTFAVFGVLALVAMVFVHRQAPETKGRRLEEIQQYWENGGQWANAERAA